MKEILTKLEDAQSIDTDQIINDFFAYYKIHNRHKYHEITIYILNKFKKAEEGETIAVILYNLEEVMIAVSKKCLCNAQLGMSICLKEQPPSFKCTEAAKGNTCSDYKRLYRNLNKLYDHISLEYARTSDIREQGARVEELIKQNSAKQIILEDTVEEATDKIDELGEQARGLQKDYITILGIFASIVLAFTGGIAFSTSVLENIDAVSPYRLAAVVIGLAFVLTNVVYILVRFIQELNKSKNEKIKYPNYMKGINAILAIALALTILGWCLFEKPYRDTLNEEYSVSVEHRIDQPTNSQSN